MDNNKEGKDKDVVLLTGATGLIGSALIKRLSAQYTLIGLDRAGPRRIERSIHTLKWLLEPAFRRSAVASARGSTRARPAASWRGRCSSVA